MWLKGSASGKTAVCRRMIEQLSRIKSEERISRRNSYQNNIRNSAILFQTNNEKNEEVVDMLAEDFEGHNCCDQVTLVHQGSFFKPVEHLDNFDPETYNFDHPAAFDLECMAKCLSDLRTGKSVYIYSFDHFAAFNLNYTSKQCS